MKPGAPVAVPSSFPLNLPPRLFRRRIGNDYAVPGNGVRMPS